MNIIDKEAKRLYKSAKGKITVSNIIKLLERYGYSVVFFNTPKGDALLESYNITPEDTTAFTVCGTTKTIFVDDSLHASDKLYALLHEYGHIVLGHIGNNQMRMQDKRRNENEAEAFAYMVLHYNPAKTPCSILLALVSAVLIIISTVFCTRAYIPRAIETSIPTEVSKAIDIPSIASNEAVRETVYVTSSGTKYHRANCRYVKTRNASELQKSEAEKTHEPCSVCKP